MRAPLSRRGTLRASPALLALALAGCAGGGASTVETPVRIAPAVTLAPQPLPAPAADRLSGQVPAGTVLRKDGPFDDRFALTGTRLSRGTVGAALRVRSDVSALIVLEAVADFYDADGALLGSTHETSAPGHEAGRGGGPGKDVPLELRAEPEYRAEVASAVLSVPVLVSE